MWPEIAVSATAGGVAGVIASLISPWVHWVIELRRERSKNRRALLQSARTLLSKGIRQSAFRRSDVYLRLKEYMDPKVVGYIDDESDEIDPELFGPGTLSEIARLEKEWKLI